MSVNMELNENITVEAHVAAPLEKVWEYWTSPGHITHWNFASSDWQCPSAMNDLRVGGMFTARMEAKDGSAGFDFGGAYTEVVPEQRIAYTMGESGRKVVVVFSQEGDQVKVTETFDPEHENPQEMQRAGWQAILNNFKHYVENA